MDRPATGPQPPDQGLPRPALAQVLTQQHPLPPSVHRRLQREGDRLDEGAAVLLAEPAALGIAQIDVEDGPFTIQPTLLARLQDGEPDGKLASLVGGEIIDTGQFLVVAAGTERFAAASGADVSWDGISGQNLESGYGEWASNLFLVANGTTVSSTFSMGVSYAGAIRIDLHGGATVGDGARFSTGVESYTLDADSLEELPLPLSPEQTCLDSCPLSDGSSFVLVRDSSLGADFVLFADADLEAVLSAQLPGPAVSLRMFAGGNDTATVLCDTTDEASAAENKKKYEAVTVAVDGTLSSLAEHADPLLDAHDAQVVQWADNYWWLGSTSPSQDDAFVRLSPDGTVTDSSIPLPPIDGVSRWVGLPDGGIMAAGPLPRMPGAYDRYYLELNLGSYDAYPSESYPDQMSWYVCRYASDGQVLWTQSGLLPPGWVVAAGGQDAEVLAPTVRGEKCTIVVSGSILRNAAAPGLYV